MSYTPQLRHVFCAPRVYQMQWHLPLYRYMNKLGMAPRILTGDENVIQHLKDNNIFFDKLTKLPDDYDVLISLTTGYMSFSRYFLEQSMRRGKINLLAIVPTLPIRQDYICYGPTQTRFLHGVCVPDTRTINILKHLNKEVIYLNTGCPMWDDFLTDDFNEQVSHVKRLFGEKLLVISVDHNIPEEFSYCEKTALHAESLGYKVIMQAHSAMQKRLPDNFSKYINPGIDRYTLFAAASHIIALIVSSMTPECLFLGAKLACKPLGTGPLSQHWGDFQWFEDTNQWYEYHQPFFEPELLDWVPLIHDEKSLVKFLSTTQKSFTNQQITELFGWPKVKSHSEHLFQVIDNYFGPHNAENVQKILKKGALEKNLTVDFMWGGEKENSPVKEITNAPILVKTGLNFLKQGNIGAATAFLRRAETISGTEHFDFVQYAMATCFYMCNNIDEAEEHIYKALFVKPDCEHYQELKNKIDAKRLNFADII